MAPLLPMANTIRRKRFGSLPKLHTYYSYIYRSTLLLSPEKECSCETYSYRQKYWSKYCWCSLMWLMPLRSLSNCDYELKNLPRLILGPIHSNQVMGTDPVGSYHGTRNSRSNSIHPTYPYQSHD